METQCFFESKFNESCEKAVDEVLKDLQYSEMKYHFDKKGKLSKFNKEIMENIIQ